MKYYFYSSEIIGYYLFFANVVNYMNFFIISYIKFMGWIQLGHNIVFNVLMDLVCEYFV